MARRQEEEEKKKGPSLPTIAAGLGIGYVAYRNRDALLSGVRKVASKTKVSLARTTSGSRFRGAIGEMKNLSKAMDEVYDLSPGGIARTIKVGGRTEQLNRQLESYNKGLAARLGRQELPDVKEGLGLLNQVEKNFGRNARQNANIKNLEDLLFEKGGKYSKAFGDRTGAVHHIVRNNEDVLFRGNRKRGQHGIDGAPLDLPVFHLLKDYQEEGKKSLPLSFKDQKEESSFMANLLDLVEEASERTESQRQAYQKMLGGTGSIEKNYYAQELESYRMAAFTAVQKQHEQTESELVKQMQAGGWRPVTMDEAAKKRIREQNGRLFLTDNKSEDLLKVEELFSNPIRESLTTGSGRSLVQTRKRNQTFATDYLREGRRYGLDEKELGKHVFSKSLFLHGETGEILNMASPGELGREFMGHLQENFRVPFIQINPLNFLPGQKTKEWGKTSFHVLQARKEVQPFLKGLGAEELPLADEIQNLNAASNKLAKSYLFMNDKIVDSSIAETLTGRSPVERFQQFQENLASFQSEDNYLLAPSRYGLMRNYAEAMANRTNRLDLEERNAFQKLFKLGGQERDSKWSEWSDRFTKFRDPNFGGHAIDTISEMALYPEDGRRYEEMVSRLHGNIYSRTRNLDPNAREALYPVLNEVLNNSVMSDAPFDLFSLVDEESIFSAAEQIASGYNPSKIRSLPKGTDEIQGEIVENLERKIHNIYEFSYKKDQAGYPEKKRVLRDRGVSHPEKLGVFFPEERELLSKTDDMKMLIEQYAIAQADLKGVSLHRPIYETEGISSKKVESQLSALRSLNETDYFSIQARSRNLEDFNAVRKLFPSYYEKGSRQRLNLSVTLLETDPFLGTGARAWEESPLGQSDFIAIKKKENMLESINRNLVEAGMQDQSKAEAVRTGVFDWVKEADTYFAGRDGNITDATVMPWFMANRLDNALQPLGLGLPQENKGSAASIVGWQFATRIAAPYIAYQYLKYADGLTGDRISDTAADTYVNMQVDVNRLKEKTGLNHLGREAQRVMPWMEQVAELPGAKAFNAVTMGAFSEFRSPEELEEYYRSGEDPVRKGRYWDIGSSSPWMGERIERFEPNWYRKMKSDYQFSENMYGSEQEYWANHWLPTPTHPFAPIRHYITDPYHYEKKHADSRPYVLTGGFSELNNIPLVGPAVNRVVSGVLKPEKMNPKYRKAHEEYLTAQNEKLVSAYASMNAGGVIEISNGSLKLASSDSYNANFVDEDGELDEEALQSDAVRYVTGRERYASSVLSGMSLSQPSGPKRILGGPVLQSREATNMAEYNQQLLSQMNQGLVDGSTTNRFDQVSRAGTLEEANLVQDPNSVINPNAFFSPNGVWKDVSSNAMEMGGMYGFMMNATMGLKENGRGATFETSERFNSLNDTFWDMNLGGFGGDFSEIFRRYLPRDQNKNYYNPIQNEMPGWLPTDNYFIDFQRGDPYRKIPKGEMRLPGQAYEKLFSVRKDAQGNYSAFDRYRILADVAPYSDEYRAAKKEVALLNQNGYLSESQQNEYRKIRSQVSQKMKKKTFYNERFQNADVRRETVTVDKVLDANTFLTLEHPNNPIKLAGVTVKADDAENQALLEEMIQPGQKLQVDLDNDPLRMVRDDMMDTIRGVVYTPKAAKSSQFGLSGLGKNQNLNYYLSQQEDVSVKDDGSATSTVALFGQNQRAFGELTERITHDVLPAIPVVNVIADKFLRAQSPVEAYEREVFSKSWRDWKHPISGWVQPMLELSASKNPLLAGMHGMGIGALMAGKSYNRWKGAWLGGLAFGTLAGGRTLLDAGSSLFGDEDIWIPKRRQKERDIDEYFDRLKYVKYKGLYEKALKEAQRQEGFDLEEYEEAIAATDSSGLKEYLNTQKKWLTIEKKIGSPNEDEIDLALADIRAELKEGDENREYGRVGPYTALALRYKDEYESTLYAAGIGETYDYNKIYRALPSKDKQYFTEFQKASPRERKRILQLVPENQRPIYERYFGLKIQKPDSIQKYFKGRPLPSDDWEGWDPSFSLDHIKLKVMKNEGIELTEGNFWEDDVQQAEKSNASAIPIEYSLLSPHINQGNLEKILRGAGLKDVRIQLVSSPAESSSFSTNLSIQEDRSREVEAGLRNYMQYS